MPNIEILTTFTETDDGKWLYTGQFLWQGNWVSIGGDIERIEHKSRFKQVLKKKVEKQIRDYIEENTPPRTFTIPAGGVFVDVLS